MANNKNTFTYKVYKKKNNEKVKQALFVISLFIILDIFLLGSLNKENGLLILVVEVITIVILLNVEKLFNEILDNIDRTWGKGAKAELSIMEDLEKMQGCRIINDFQMNKGNIDHICISPTGIFTIETKGSYGVISYGEGGLKINGKEIDKDFLRQARGEAFFLDKLIKEKLKKDYYIVPILVFANAKIDTKTIPHPIENVWICQRGFECKVIENSKDHLREEEVNKIYNLLLEIKKKENE